MGRNAENVPNLLPVPGRLICLPNSYVKNNLKLPDEFEYHASYSPSEVHAFLWDPDSEALLGPDWILVYINVIRFPNFTIYFISIMPSINL